MTKVLLALVALALLLYPVLLRVRFGPRWRPVVLGYAATLAGGFAILWLFAWARLALHPIAVGLAHAPHPVLGWTLAPGLRFPSTGAFGEFLVDVQVNSRGFRDREHAREKPAGTRRVALLGDSLVEATQVPLAETTASLLEARLNGRGAGQASPGRWEVMNFGVTNYGLGQFLLAWEEAARPLAPDVVVVLVAGFHFARTVDPYSEWSGSGERLWIRPIFRLEGETLVRMPPRDLELFRRRQAERIQGAWGGRRVHLQTPLEHLASLVRLLTEARTPPPVEEPVGEAWAEVAAVNLYVLDELRREVALSGGRLVVLDAIRFFNGELALLSTMLENYCRRTGTTRLDASAALAAAAARGERLRWPRDGHFTAAGHGVLADLLARDLAQGPGGS